MANKFKTLTRYGYTGPTKVEERDAVKRGAVWIAKTGDWSYDVIAVGRTEAEARLVARKAVREANPFLTVDDEHIDSGVSVFLLAPGEASDGC